MLDITLEAEVIKQFGTRVTFDVRREMNLEPGERYVLKISKPKDRRSIEQNALMWGIIRNLSKKTGNSVLDIYISGLIHANVQSVILFGIPEIQSALEKGFRAVKVIDSQEVDGKTILTYECYGGSSKFNTAEMKELTDYFMQLEDEYDAFI